MNDLYSSCLIKISNAHNYEHKVVWESLSWANSIIKMYLKVGSEAEFACSKKAQVVLF